MQVPSSTSSQDWPSRCVGLAAHHACPAHLRGGGGLQVLPLLRGLLLLCCKSTAVTFMRSGHQHGSLTVMPSWWWRHRQHCVH